MDNNFINEKKILNRLNSDDELFEREFENLRHTFPMESCVDIHNFLKENRGVIIILKNVKELLGSYVPYSQFKLRLDVDPLFVPQLQLIVKAPKHNFENGFKEDIRKITSSIRPFLLNFDLGKEFFICYSILRDEK